jgi:hypothetical protein
VLLQWHGYPINLCVPESKEKNESATQRLDILLKNHSCYVLELCANVNTPELQKHLARTAKYQYFGIAYFNFNFFFIMIIPNFTFTY